MSRRGSKARAWCFRCGAELPANDGETQYCSACGAVQLRLSEGLELETPELEAGAQTTGAVPPPRPQMVDWRALLRCAGLVGAIAAALMALGLAVESIDALGTLWMLASGLAAAWMYTRMRPQMRMDARVGVRVGVVSGVTTVTLVGVVLLIGGLVSRFVLHRAGSMDDWVNRMMTMFLTQVNSQPQGPVLGTGAVDILESPAGHAGYMLLNFAVDAGFVVAVAAASGAVAGSLTRRRSRMGRAL